MAFRTGAGPQHVLRHKTPSGQVVQRLEGELGKMGIQVIGAIPNDADVFDASLEGRILEKGAALRAAEAIFDRLMA